MMVRWFTVLFFMVQFVCKSISADSTHYGPVFVLAVPAPPVPPAPQQNRSTIWVEFYLVTSSNRPVAVIVTSWRSNSAPPDVILVTRDAGYVYKVPQFHERRAKAYTLKGINGTFSVSVVIRLADVMAADVTRANVTSPDVTRSNASGYDTGDVSPPNADGARDGGGDVRVADSYLAVPVSAWGVRYFLVTLQSRPAVHLVTADDSTGIQVVLKSSEPALFALKYLAKTYRNGDTLHIRLGRWQVLPLFDCWNNTYAGDVTGTIITSTRPVGVTSGRCVTCEGDAGIVFTTQEMLLPAPTYGWNFVLVTDLDQMDTTLVTVVTSENLTLIGLWQDDSNDVSTWITNTGDMLQINLTSRPRLLSSTKPVLVTVALQVRCQGSSVAMGTPTLILPTSLFYNTYLWRPLTNCSVQVRCHVTFVVEREVAATLVLDHVHVTSGHKLDTWVSVVGAPHWMVTSLEVNGSLHEAYTGQGYPFGCYTSTSGVSSKVMQPAGFMAAAIYHKQCLFSPSVQGDMIDNDCDGHIDEELRNFKDDDGDAMVDEDLTRDPEVSRPMGEWSSWTCREKCTNSTWIRYRSCNSPQLPGEGLGCEGQLEETRAGLCLIPCVHQVTVKDVHHEHPEHQERHQHHEEHYEHEEHHEHHEHNEHEDHHGLSPTLNGTEHPAPMKLQPRADEVLSPLAHHNTTVPVPVLDCNNCDSKCRTDGVCTSCLPGFQFSETTLCNFECRSGYYGADCKGVCKEKCDEDCLDRATGQCPGFNYMRYLPWAIAVVAVLLVLFLVYRLRRRGRKDDDDDVKDESNEEPAEEEEGERLEIRDITSGTVTNTADKPSSSYLTSSSNPSRTETQLSSSESESSRSQ